MPDDKTPLKYDKYLKEHVLDVDTYWIDLFKTNEKYNQLANFIINIMDNVKLKCLC